MSNETKGVTEVDVAKLKLFLIKSGIVVVALEKYLMVKLAAEEEEMRMMSESKRTPPLMESFSAGVEVPRPRKFVEVRKVTFDPVSVKGEQMSLN